MSGFTETMRLKEMAEEDIYFARKDRELIEALRRKKARGPKVVSGGQTGVDRAALDAAMAAGLAVGGWCPAGRIALDGRIPERYPLRETPSSLYAQRTEWNVRDSDATLILTRGEPSGGTRLTAELAKRYGRPLLIVDLGDAPPLAEVLGWLKEHRISVLNVAGPREESALGIYEQAGKVLTELLRGWVVSCGS